MNRFLSKLFFKIANLVFNTGTKLFNTKYRFLLKLSLVLYYIAGFFMSISTKFLLK